MSTWPCQVSRPICNYCKSSFFLDVFCFCNCVDRICLFRFKEPFRLFRIHLRVNSSIQIEWCNQGQSFIHAVFVLWVFLRVLILIATRNVTTLCAFIEINIIISWRPCTKRQNERERLEKRQKKLTEWKTTDQITPSWNKRHVKMPYAYQNEMIPSAFFPRSMLFLFNFIGLKSSSEKIGSNWHSLWLFTQKKCIRNRKTKVNITSRRLRRWSRFVIYIEIDALNFMRSCCSIFSFLMIKH